MRQGAQGRRASERRRHSGGAAVEYLQAPSSRPPVYISNLMYNTIFRYMYMYTSYGIIFYCNSRWASPSAFFEGTGKIDALCLCFLFFRFFPRILFVCVVPCQFHFFCLFSFFVLVCKVMSIHVYFNYYIPIISNINITRVINPIIGMSIIGNNSNTRRVRLNESG